MARLLPVVLRAGLAGCLACDGDDPGADPHSPIELPDVEVRYRTKYVDVAPVTDTPICAGDLAMMDDHIDHMLELLGLQFEGRIPMYFVHPGEPEPNPWCRQWTMSGRAAGCFADGTVFTGLLGVPHELVHAITASGRWSWWGEGVAYAFSGFAPIPEWTVPENFTVEEWLGRLGESGHLSRWLIERYGGPTYMELYSRTPHGSDQAAVEAAVRDVLGQGLDEVLSEYAATAGYIYPDHWSCYVSPTTVESPFVGDYWTHEATLDCDAPDTFSNGDLEEQRMTARIPVTLPSAGRYDFVVDHPDAEMYLQPCLDAPTQEFDLSAYSWPIKLSPIVSHSFSKAGAYVLIVNVPPGGPTKVRVAGYVAIGDSKPP